MYDGGATHKNLTWSVRLSKPKFMRDYILLGDNKIDRRNHAIIVFDPKKKETVLLPGSSNGLVYLQGDALYERM